MKYLVRVLGFKKNLGFGGRDKISITVSLTLIQSLLLSGSVHTTQSSTLFDLR
jgi:hypothetical protein